MSIELDEKGWKEYKKGQEHLINRKYELARDYFNAASEHSMELAYLSGFWLYILCGSEHYKVPNQAKASEFKGMITGAFKFSNNDEMIARLYQYPDGPMILAYLQQKEMIPRNFNYSPGKFYEEFGGEPSVFFYQFRAEFYLDKKKYMEARRDFDRAIKMDKQFIPAWFGYAKCQRYLKTHDSMAAHSYFGNIVKECPEDHETWYEWGMLCSHEENYQEAQSHFNQALRFDPKNAGYKKMLEMIQLNNVSGFWRTNSPSVTPSRYGDSKLRRSRSITSEEEKMSDQSPVELSMQFSETDLRSPSESLMERKFLSSIRASDLDHQEIKQSFFSEKPSAISKKHKITKDTWNLFLACQIGPDQCLNWEKASCLFFEGIDGENYFLERYFLKRDQINYARVLVEQLQPSNILLDDTVEGTIQVNLKNESSVRYYIALQHWYPMIDVNRGYIKAFFRSVIKDGHKFKGTKFFGTTEISLNHWMWCNFVIRNQIDSNGAPRIDQLPKVIRENTPIRDSGFCIVC